MRPLPPKKILLTARFQPQYAHYNMFFAATDVSYNSEDSTRKNMRTYFSADFAHAPRVFALCAIFLLCFAGGCSSVNLWQEAAGGIAHFSDEELPGNIYISPSGLLAIGTLLTAVYSGSEDIRYQWNKNGKAVPGVTGARYTLEAIGIYTVTIRAVDYRSKTSAPVTIQTRVSVRFDSMGGSYVPSQTVIKGGYAERPVPPSKAVSGFVNWYADANLSGAPYDFEYTPVTADITLYAKWALPLIRVTFDPQEGDLAQSQLVQVIGYGGMASAPNPAPVNGGYFLNGWYQDAACTIPWNFARNTVTEDITLYAKWELKFTVTFDCNGGTPPIMSLMAAQGEKVSPPGTPTKPDHEFIGWCKDPGCTIAWIFAIDTIEGNTTIYAKWIRQFTVNFIGNGGPVPESRTVLQGGKVSDPGELVRSGHVFGGWYTDNDTFMLQWVFTTHTVTSNTILYAKWTQQFAVRFLRNDGTLIETRYINKDLYASHPLGTPASVPYTRTPGLYDTPVPAQGAACAFSHWQTPSGEVWVLASNKVTADIALTAQYTMPNPVAAVDVNNIAAAVTHARNDPGAYFLLISEDARCAPQTLDVPGVDLTIEGIGSELLIMLSQDGTLFTVGAANAAGIRLTLGENITLAGSGTAGLVMVQNDATFTMQPGSKITGNTADNGGGVYVREAIFTMAGGTISGNIARGNGGGVYIDNGDFFMTGGTISGNTTQGNGGGVYITGSGSFTMTSGTIKGNNASGGYGGGVYVGGSVLFNKIGGTISGMNASPVADRNRANGVEWGHAAYVQNGGKYRSNTAGTGVNLNSGKTANWGQ
jgi:uncharacterized repeat protein (TIGR02543 family)